MRAVVVEDFDQHGRCPNPDCASESISLVEELCGGTAVNCCNRCRNPFAVTIRDDIRHIQFGGQAVRLRFVKYPSHRYAEEWAS